MGPLFEIRIGYRHEMIKTDMYKYRVDDRTELVIGYCCCIVDVSAVVETFGFVCNVITGVEVVVGSAA